MNEYLQRVGEWTTAGLRVAEAMLVSTQYSSPRMPGARLAVNEQGAMEGGVSMGCVENDLREHLLALLRGEGEERMVRYGQAFAASMEVGLSCGGEIQVWLRRLMAGTEPPPPAERAMGLTRLAPGGSTVWWRAGEMLPEGVAKDAGAMAEVERLWRQGGTRLLKTAEGLWFAELRESTPLLLVVGASPVAVALCGLASCAGWRVKVVDPRCEFARTDRFPGAEAVVHEWPEEGLSHAGMNAESYVAVLAHDAKLDVPALAAALRAKCRYVGLLGSLSTQEERKALLREEGMEEDALGRIRGPIGLKELGGVEPAEIAVSILAELIKVKRGRG